MTASKLVQIAKEIDDARSRGNYRAIPELARRYRKYNPQGEVLAETIQAEAELGQLCEMSGKPATHHRLEAKQTKSIQRKLESAIGMKNSDVSCAKEKEFARIILARSYFECGDFTKTLEILSVLSLPRHDISAGYGAVLFSQAYTMKAVAIEASGDKLAALKGYEDMAVVFKTMSFPVGKVVADWAEEGLYRGSILALKSESGNVEYKLEILRAYQRFVASQPNIWQQKRWMAVAEQSLRYLCQVFRQGDYCPPDKSARQSVFMVEMAQLHAVYEKMVLTSAKFPSANQVSKAVHDYSDLVAEIVGTAPWSVADLKNFAEALNRAAQKSFNSPRVTRHLFNVFVKAGEYQEARYALKAYMHMTGFTTQSIDETKGHGEAFATNAEGISTPIPIINKKDIQRMVQDSGYGKFSESDDGNDDGGDNEEDKPKPTKPSASRFKLEKESIVDVIQMFLTGIKMFCEETEEGAEAVKMAEIAKNVFNLQDEKFKQQSKSLGARVLRAAGAAYGLLASQTTDPVTRSTYHSQAGDLLQQSLDLDPNAWQTYYQLALEQGETRDIHHAVQTITKSLQLNADHVPSWHLLVLACSCPIQGNLEQALKTSQMCLERIQGDIKDDQQEELNDEVDDIGSRPDFEKNEQRILLQMAQLKLLKVARGPEEALEFQKDLFGDYSSSISIPEEAEPSGGLYHDSNNGRNTVILSGSLNNLSDSTDINSRSSVLIRNPNGSASSTVSEDSVRTVPNLEAILQTPHHRRLHPSLHLFRTRSNRKSRNPSELGDRSQSSLKTQAVTTATARAGDPMQASVTSLQSALPSLSSTRSIIQYPTNLSACTRPTARSRLRRGRSTRILCNLWLLSANSFLELGMYDEALKAIEEAENVDWTGNAGVWCALGRLRLSEQRVDCAITAFQKGLVCEESSVECRVWLAKAYIQHGDLEVAEGLLDFVTRGIGWNDAEAWYYLGEVYRKTQRLERAKDCFLYALELEKTQPIQPFTLLRRCI